MQRVLCLCLDHWEQMQAHVLECLPEEGCGLLGGKGRQVEMCIPVTNAEHSPVRFFMEPVEQLRAMKAIESQGLEVIGIFHSHPNGPAHPSATDLKEFAYPGVTTLIWSPVDGRWQLKGYWIEAGAADPVELILQRNAPNFAGF